MIDDAQRNLPEHLAVVIVCVFKSVNAEYQKQRMLRGVLTKIKAGERLSSFGISIDGFRRIMRWCGFTGAQGT